MIESDNLHQDSSTTWRFHHLARSLDIKIMTMYLITWMHASKKNILYARVVCSSLCLLVKKTYCEIIWTVWHIRKLHYWNRNPQLVNIFVYKCVGISHTSKVYFFVVENITLLHASCFQWKNRTQFYSSCFSSSSYV